jgi:uncharacterized membrane protein
MAVIWGGGLPMQFFGIRATMSGVPARLATLGQDIEWIANRGLHPFLAPRLPERSPALVQSDFYGFGDDWIVIGLTLYATTFLAGSSSSARNRVALGGSPRRAPPRPARGCCA